MRTFLTRGLSPVVLCVAGTFLAATDAQAVAGFTRQTGMNCNSCHTLHGAPTPNFTFTGRKFKAAGYRLPQGTGHTQERAQEQGKESDWGEYLSILPVTWSGRMQYTSANVSKPAGSDEWGEVTTNPTSRFALFPFTGPIGQRFGVWTEVYIVPFTSQDGEWGIADTSYEEFDFRYILNPGSKDRIFGLAMSNQSIYELFGYGPYPGLPSFINRGGVGGYSHPNKAQVYTYGWMDNRWVWAAGADTGDTNMGWDRSNVLALFGYAIKNRNDNEMWLNVIGRTGEDALPLLTASGADRTSRSWTYRDAVGGVSATRLGPGGVCLGAPGRRVAGSCAYIAEDLDSFSSFDVELRMGGQNVDRFFGNERKPGVWSFEHVARVTTNSEDYFDGGSTDRDTWGVSTVIGYKHTWYLKPLISGDFKYEFTDRLGTLHDIDTDITWNLTVAFKPAENFLIYASYNNLESVVLPAGVQPSSGRAFQITADLSF
jgi:hypothetical protein